MENVKLNFAHVCDYAFNGEGGKICIIGIFENIYIPKNVNGNVTHPQMFIVTNMTVSKGTNYRQIIELIKSDNSEKSLAKLEFPTILIPQESQDSQVNVIGRFNNISFPSEGNYIFKISISNGTGGVETLKELPLYIKSR